MPMLIYANCIFIGLHSSVIEQYTCLTWKNNSQETIVHFLHYKFTSSCKGVTLLVKHKLWIFIWLLYHFIIENKNRKLKKRSSLIMSFAFMGCVCFACSNTCKSPFLKILKSKFHTVEKSGNWCTFTYVKTINGTCYSFRATEMNK